MNPKTLLWLALSFSLLATPLSAEATLGSPASGFQSLLPDYETVRQALVADRLEGIAQAAESLVAKAGAIEPDADQGSLLEEIENAALDLAQATDLATAREAFYALSKPLVRYRKAAGAKRPVVAYCSMSKKSWLQPKGEIGNPYHGQEMPTCGQVVDG